MSIAKAKVFHEVLGKPFRAKARVPQSMSMGLLTFRFSWHRLRTRLQPEVFNRLCRILSEQNNEAIAKLEELREQIQIG